MRVLNGVDVNDLYFHGMEMLRAHGEIEDSRVGKVLVMPWPVTSVYGKPRQRVLHDVKRAANPFFHLFESLWMLAGRDDVAALNRFITDFGTRFAESDGKVHGAYGHRWRKALGYDQLDVIVEKLRNSPSDRQCVLQMWDAREPRCPAGECDAPGTGSKDLRGDWKDRPCNTHVYFRVRNSRSLLRGENYGGNVLDMTVSCRSNDIVYGAYGANAVHFSILQEYMAGRIGVGVGQMYQISNNYHAYLDVLDRVGFPALVSYDSLAMEASLMGNDWAAWDDDLEEFMFWHGSLLNGATNPGHYKNLWFSNTAEPMFTAHFLWKQAMRNEAVAVAGLIEAEDWRCAALQWFTIRSNARSR